MFTMPSSNTADLARLLAYESTDGGVTWPVANDIISTSGVASNPITYAFAVGAGIDDLIHISWTVGNHVTYTRTNLYHATLDPTDGTLRSVDGTSLGTSVDASDHPTCLAFTGSNVWSFRQTMTEDRIHIVFHLGTDDGTVDGTYTVRVATWDGAAWSAVDTTAPTRWRWGQHQVLPYRDGLVGLFCEWNGTAQDVTAWVAPDDASVWRKAGTVLPAESGNGYIGVMVPAGDGPFLVMSDQIGADWANDPTSGLGTIAGLFRPPALDGHTHEYEPTGAIADHNTDPDAHPDLAIILPNETVFTPGYSVTDATTLDLAITFVWGIDGIGEPYYNATGVTAGEEAVLVLNNDTGELALRPVEV